MKVISLKHLELLPSFSFSLKGGFALNSNGPQVKVFASKQASYSSNCFFPCILHLVKCLVWTRPDISFETYRTDYMFDRALV